MSNSLQKFLEKPKISFVLFWPNAKKLHFEKHYFKAFRLNVVYLCKHLHFKPYTGKIKQV